MSIFDDCAAQFRAEAQFSYHRKSSISDAKRLKTRFMRN